MVEHKVWILRNYRLKFTRTLSFSCKKLGNHRDLHSIKLNLHVCHKHHPKIPRLASQTQRYALKSQQHESQQPSDTQKAAKLVFEQWFFQKIHHIIITYHASCHFVPQITCSSSSLIEKSAKKKRSDSDTQFSQESARE